MASEVNMMGPANIIALVQRLQHLTQAPVSAIAYDAQTVTLIASPCPRAARYDIERATTVAWRVSAPITVAELQREMEKAGAFFGWDV